jgi:hypothetical protein
MQAQIVRPRAARLALWLSISAILSAAIIVLHACTIQGLSPALLVFAIPSYFTLALSGIYLVRLYQRRAAQAEWPTTRLFPEDSPRLHSTTIALLAFAIQVVYGQLQLPSQGVRNLRWPEDVVAMALVAVYWLELVTSFIVFAHFASARTAEDKVRCAGGEHEMFCKKCKYFERNMHKRDPLPTRLRIHPIRMLVPSMILAATLAYTLQVPPSVSPGIQSFLQAYAVVAALAVVHRAYFIIRAQLASLRPQADTPAWPATPMWSRKWERVVYTVGCVVSFELYLFAAGTAATEHWAFWRQGPMEQVAGACLAGLVVLDGALFFHALKMDNVERAARCVSDGHAWKCTRLGCKDQAKVADQISDVKEKEHVPTDVLVNVSDLMSIARLHPLSVLSQIDCV